MSVPGPQLVDVGVAQWSLDQASGDVHVVHGHDEGVLLAVIDGLGHGRDANAAATAAQDTLRARGADSPQQLLAACHEALRRTRGVVLSLACIGTSGTMSWAGVGNVEGVLVPRRSPSSPRLLGAVAGIVGHRLPSIRVGYITVTPGDTVVLATDGIDPGSVLGADPRLGPQANADRILAEGASRRDDALVLVGRYRGGPG